MPADPPECVPRSAQHSQHADRPRRPHRSLGLRALPGEVLLSSRAQLLQIKVLGLQAHWTKADCG